MIPEVKLRRCALCAALVPQWRLTCLKHGAFLKPIGLAIVAALVVVVLSAIN